jgi:hypothetical protein
MKKTFFLFFCLVVSPFLIGQTTNNTSNLGKSDPDLETIFATFESSQDFVQDMYALVVSYELQAHTFQDYLLGDDGFVDTVWKASRDIDAGNFNAVLKDNFIYLNNHYNSKYGSTGSNSANLENPNTFNRQRPGLWDGSIHGIRKANIVIQNIDILVNATQAEKDVILGQAYFFRAFFHNEIMKFWGRFPYITEVFDEDNIKISIPRPETYKEVALLANEDYKKAATLLPTNWDEEAFGAPTLGKNKNKLTKGIAYAFQGKNLLLAASPLMFYNNSGINTYTYDNELCDMAVDAFAEIFKLNTYSLASWENYDEVFWKTPVPDTWPGSSEFIFAAILGNKSQTQRFMTSGVPRAIHTSFTGYEVISATHNYIHHNFGMANGLSIEDDLSGNFGTPTYNPNQPFENRDPRFYKWHIIDRQIIDSKADNAHKTAQLWFESSSNKGIHRSTGAESRKTFNTTGYIHTKFYPKIEGKYHNNWNPIIDQYNGVRLHMRLTDVYLMYAEALHASKGPKTAPLSYPSLTAEGAVNALRKRAGITDVHNAIVTDNNKFMDEIRRERAVELSYEGHRWLDIRRWGIAHEDKYRIKTALNFDKNWESFSQNVLVKRVCEYPKHYWLPIPPNRIKFPNGFPQNPGWESIPLSVKDISNKEDSLLVFPNPSNDVYQLSEVIEYSIYDITGRLILVGKGKSIDLSTHSKGVYLLRYENKIKQIIRY